MKKKKKKNKQGQEQSEEKVNLKDIKEENYKGKNRKFEAVKNKPGRKNEQNGYN